MSCPYFDNNAKRYCQAPFMNELGWSRLTMPRRSGLIPMMQRRIEIWRQQKEKKLRKQKEVKKIRSRITNHGNQKTYFFMKLSLVGQK